jgi:hypothetical protein
VQVRERERQPRASDARVAPGPVVAQRPSLRATCSHRVIDLPESRRIIAALPSDALGRPNFVHRQRSSP